MLACHHQAIIRTYDGSLLIVHLGTNFSESYWKYKDFRSIKCTLRCVSKLAASLCRSLCVNSSVHSEMYANKWYLNLKRVILHCSTVHLLGFVWLCSWLCPGLCLWLCVRLRSWLSPSMSKWLRSWLCPRLWPSVWLAKVDKKRQRFHVWKVSR